MWLVVVGMRWRVWGRIALVGLRVRWTLPVHVGVARSLSRETSQCPASTQKRARRRRRRREGWRGGEWNWVRCSVSPDGKRSGFGLDATTQSLESEKINNIEMDIKPRFADCPDPALVRKREGKFHVPVRCSGALECGGRAINGDGLPWQEDEDEL